MTIDKIQGINPGNLDRKPNFNRPSSTKINDTVSISSEARAFQRYMGQFELRNNPIVRQDKVEQAKLNLEKYFVDGELTGQVAEKIADKIADSLLI